LANTANYVVTASYASLANTANHVATASYADVAGTANYTALAITANYATTANYAGLATTANHALTANYAEIVSTNYVTNNYSAAVTINNRLVVSGDIMITANGKYYGNGSRLSRTVTRRTTNTSLDTNYSVVLMDASVATRNVTLPLANTATGNIYTIKKVDSSANNIRITAYTLDGADWLDGIAAGDYYFLTAQYQSITVISDGVDTWYIIGKN
jgi:hypothetical protein